MNRAPSINGDAAKGKASADTRTCERQVDSAPFINKHLPRLLHDLAVCLPLRADIQTLCVWLDQPGGNAVQLRAVVGELPASLKPGMSFPAADPIANWVWKRRRTITIDTSAETHFPEFALALAAAGVECFCAVPLKAGNQLVGVLGFFAVNREALHGLDPEFAQLGVANGASASEYHAAPESLNGFRGRAASAGNGMTDENKSNGIIGRSAVISALREEIRVVAPTGATTLILGETGTGKELVARAIHNLSSRRDQAFIKVNCAAIPAGLIESELFGHERGAFTGAVARRTGRFQLADGGTLFLDEIGDTPLELQPKLLRVLQEQEFERVGGSATMRVDVRIVAATSRNLPQMVSARQFRADLYYRLNVLPLNVPALRERSEDIPLLVRHFVELHAKRSGVPAKGLPIESMEALLQHPWPGNVRELQNVVERAVILSDGKVLRPHIDEVQISFETTNEAGAGKREDRATLRDADREYIIRALAATNWVIGGPRGAAARLGLNRTTLIAKMQKLGITRTQA